MGQLNIKHIFLVSFIIFFIPQPVAAYLDPGFGSMVWQVVAAVVFGIAFTLKIYWIKLKDFFRRTKE